MKMWIWVIALFGVSFIMYLLDGLWKCSKNRQLSIRMLVFVNNVVNAMLYIFVVIGVPYSIIVWAGRILFSPIYLIIIIFNRLEYHYLSKQ